MKRDLVAALLSLGLVSVATAGEAKPFLPTPAPSIYGYGVYFAIAGIHQGPVFYSVYPGDQPLVLNDMGILIDGATSGITALARNATCSTAQNPNRCDLDRRRAEWIERNLRLIVEDYGGIVGGHYQPYKHLRLWYSYCTTSVEAHSVIDEPDDLWDVGLIAGRGKCTDAIVMRVNWPKGLQDTTEPDDAPRSGRGVEADLVDAHGDRAR